MQQYVRYCSTLQYVKYTVAVTVQLRPSGTVRGLARLLRFDPVAAAAASAAAAAGAAVGMLCVYVQQQYVMLLQGASLKLSYCAARRNGHYSTGTPPSPSTAAA